MSEYTVKHINGCLVVFGGIPAGDFAALSGTMPKDCCLDVIAARYLGASFVAGQPEDTAKLLELPPCDELIAEVRAAKKVGLSEQAQQWLLRGERGQSSNCIFHTLTRQEGGKIAHPYDPADLRRCRLLLERVPEFAPRIREMVAVSPDWARIVSMWDVLCGVMDDECPDWRDGVGSAKTTYRLMQKVG